MNVLFLYIKSGHFTYNVQHFAKNPARADSYEDMNRLPYSVNRPGVKFEEMVMTCQRVF